MHGGSIRTELIRSSAAWICSSCAAKLGRSKPLRRAYSQETRGHGKLPAHPARTRFAPSPTGYMHIGGLRTALFSYLLAKATGGQFILRIEDTDQKRFVPGALERLCDDLQWAGLQWDEGPVVGGSSGPYQQSHRTEIYQRHAKELLDTGAAYRCFCTPQTLGAGSQAYVTSGCYQSCSSLDQSAAEEKSSAEPYTIRLRPSSDVFSRKYPDLIYGNIKRLKRTPGAALSSDEAADPSDTILLKTDGTPTYHFANVVDDHLMRITHVIRGTEWMASTPLHYDLYHAFGWQPPTFAHVGLLLDRNKAKLSKRNADLALDVQVLKDEHDILPESLCNFLALQGWSNPASTDVLDMQELIRSFDLKFTKGNTMVTMDKLWFLQRNHVQRRCQSALKLQSDESIRPVVGKLVSVAQELYPGSQLQQSAGLEDLCTILLLLDSRAFRDAKQFMQRQAYIFDFKPGETTIEPDADLDGLVAAILRSHELSEAAQVLADTHGLARYEDLHSAHIKINHVLAVSLWRHVLRPESSDRVATALAERASDADIADITGLEADAATSLLKQYQTAQKALMKRLRAQLCGGSPGPSISYIIPLLGMDECRKRIGVGAGS